MRASISYKDVASAEYPWTSRHCLGCMQRCHVDHLFMAYHRSAAPFLLPYNAHLDAAHWWASGYTTNLLMAAVAPAHCSYYREIMILDVDLQIHEKAYVGGYDFRASKQHVLNCLRRARWKGSLLEDQMDNVVWWLRKEMAPVRVSRVHAG